MGLAVAGPDVVPWLVGHDVGTWVGSVICKQRPDFAVKYVNRLAAFVSRECKNSASRSDPEVVRDGPGSSRGLIRPHATFRTTLLVTSPSIGGCFSSARPVP